METFSLVLRVLVSLGAVLALVWWFQRRLTRGVRASGAEPLVRVVTRQAISPKASVVVVDSEGRRFLLGVTETSVNVLHSAETGTETGIETRAETGAETSTDAGTGPAAVPPASFDAVLDAASYGPGTAPSSEPRLAGSVLSPSTWRQTAAFVRGGRNG